MYMFKIRFFNAVQILVMLLLFQSLKAQAQLKPLIPSATKLPSAMEINSGLKEALELSLIHI